MTRLQAAAVHPGSCAGDNTCRRGKCRPGCRNIRHLPDSLLPCTLFLVLQTPEEERKRLLSFVVCGGGPTGVEVAAEMHDMIFDDLKV